MKLEIQDLAVKAGYDDGEVQRKAISIDVSPQTDLCQLFEDHPEIVKPDGLALISNPQRLYWVNETVNAPQQQRLIEVVDGPSDFFEGKINVRDTVSAFLDLKAPKGPMSAKLSASGTAASKTLFVDDNLEIRFHRTIRLPDDNRIHPLPASTGTFPLFNVNAFSHILPQDVASKGGIFFPMWQREAMWIELEAFEHLGSSGATQYAVRINLGEINAVTGRSIRDPSEKQDYVLVPGQNWVDGILVEPGVVRQFVAMPLGRGYTVEGQVTGEEKIGGLQIEITPRISNDIYKDTRFFLSGSGELDTLTSPQDKNIPTGSKISMRWDYHSRKPKVVDLIDDHQGEDFDQSFVLGAYYFDFYSRSSSMQDGYQTRSKRQKAEPQSVQQSHSDLSTVTGCSEEIASQRLPSLAARRHDKGKPSAVNTLQTMGIAVGGKLMQCIYTDITPGAQWQKTRTRLINVQIFDAATFEAATHIVPPPTPVTAKTYADAGHPFWVVEEEPENRVGPSETLSAVKSVSVLDKETGVSEDQSEEVDPSKPTKCKTCQKRLCDCVIRPCDHKFCSECITAINKTEGCPICGSTIKHVAGFSAPMNLPGEETYKANVPVVMLEVKDGRASFRECTRMRM